MLISVAAAAAAVLLMAAGTRADDVCFTCKCNNQLIDCTSSDLKTQPTLGDLSNGTKELRLDNNAISKIRVMESSTSLLSLSLRHNRISVIEERAFEQLPTLTSLDLSHNILTSEVLRPAVFKGADRATRPGSMQLTVLNLSSNSLHTLHQDLFEFLPDLQQLYLASNPFRTLDHGTLVALSSLIRIKVLDLSSTHLSMIPPQWLNAAKNLETLNLAMNNLTTVPVSLQETRSLKHLILDNNPIAVISSFPKLPTLETLHMSWMQKLVSVKDHSLVNLPNLKELYLSHNNYLVQLSQDALVEPGTNNQPEGREGAIFPPLEKLVLNDNRLRYLEQGLLDRWDRLVELRLEGNPWSCDCHNQWMLSTLIPLLLEHTQLGLASPKSLICGDPVEMRGQAMVELASRSYQMRCLDIYGNEPDRDAKVLIIVLAVVLIAIPASLLLLHLVKRPRRGTAAAGYPSAAYYRRAHSFETIN